MSVDSSESDSNTLQAENAIAIPTKDAGETVVETLRDHRGFCLWCLAPLEVNPVVQFSSEGPKDTLETGGTYRESAGVVRDYPPGERDEHCICRECGRIDVARRESRKRETTEDALDHVVSILRENGVGVDVEIARESVAEAFDERRTGQFVRTLGEAVYRATE